MQILQSALTLPPGRAAAEHSAHTAHISEYQLKCKHSMVREASTHLLRRGNKARELTNSPEI